MMGNFTWKQPTGQAFVMNAVSNPKHQAILRAAKRAFLAHGYRGASMEAIAEAAPVSKPTLYSHFNGKQELFAAVITDQCRALLDTLSSVQASTLAAEASLRRIAMSFAYLIYSAESLSLLRLIIAEHQAFPELSELVHRSGVQPVFKRLTAYLVELHEAEVLSIPDAEQSAKLFLGMLQGNDHVRCLMGLRPIPDPSEKEKLVDAAVGLFLRGHGRSGPRMRGEP